MEQESVNQAPNESPEPVHVGGRDSLKIIIQYVLPALLLVSVIIYVAIFDQHSSSPTPPGTDTEQPDNGGDDTGEVTVVEVEQPDGTIVEVPLPAKQPVSSFRKFASNDEYTSYLQEANSGYYGSGALGFSSSVSTVRSGGILMDADMGVAVNEMAPGVPMPVAAQADGTSPTRYSETNVQVTGIDEPDILKTDGEEIYFSTNLYRDYIGIPTPMPVEPMMEPMMVDDVMVEEASFAPPEYEFKGPTTLAINAFPVDQLALDGEIEASGELLLHDDVLMVFSGNKITGYDVSDPAAATETWAVDLENSNRIVQSRLYDGQVYLVSSSYRRNNPCPMPVYRVANEIISVPCTDIYRPDRIVPVRATYNIHTLDPNTGTLSHGISFVGTYEATVYMSANALYVAYGYDQDPIDMFFGIVKENADLFPATLRTRLEDLMALSISAQAKMVEFQVIVEEYHDALSDDERLRLENEMEDRMDNYLKTHLREFTSTDVVKIDINDFAIAGLGTVPGHLLNQFSLDEYQGHLRLVTTLSDGGWDSMGNENDLYVLDGDMDIVGSALGMGLDERVYSARFIQDKGYVVTFRQTDPFYVLDLSDPRNPSIEGELKIPGYSSYLHPISQNLILGVGKEDANVKASLFDVSDPKNPVEADKYTLKEYWTDILNTHHAFLQDSHHEVFFLPGNQGGYVISYKNNDLTLLKAVSGINAKRAVFIDDYLYIFGDNKVVVLDETSWERVNELSF